MKHFIIAVTVACLAAVFTSCRTAMPPPGPLAQSDTVTFLAIGCGPYKTRDYFDLERYIEVENALPQGEFMIHLGDIFRGTTPVVEESLYSRVAAILRGLNVPVFIVPGDNEWNDTSDPDQAWRYWKANFTRFEEHWTSDPGFYDRLLPTERGISHDRNRDENFAFVRKGVLFVGINLPGGLMHDRDEWAARLPQNAQWIDHNLKLYGDRVHAAVVFAQANPGNSTFEPFVEPLRAACKSFGKPVLLLHADGHRFLIDHPWPEQNILRVQTDELGIARPLLVTVRKDALPTFQFDRQQRRDPYLALGTPESMVVVWRTGHAIEPSVRIGSAPHTLHRVVNQGSIKVRATEKHAGGDALHSAPPEIFQYEAQITGLKPATTYYYAIYDGNKPVAGGDDSYHFTTSPPHGSTTPFTFWVVGDSGTGDQNQADVHNAMHQFVKKQDNPIDLYLHVGDMAYSSGTDAEFQQRFFKPYEATLRSVICWPTMGNHEGSTSDGKTGVGPYYDAYVLPTRGEAGGVPSGTEAYYSFDYANAHFICLDSHDLDRRPSGAMARWLKRDLEKTRGDWVIAFWHHAPYTKGSHDSDIEVQLVEMREHIMPILEAGGVDVVFTGHSHIYERSMLMDGAYESPTVAQYFILDDGDGDPDGDGAYRKSQGLHPHEGTVQVVTGHGGTGVSRKGTMPVMKRVFVEHGSVIVDVEGDTLTSIMINAKGEKRDLFSVVKRGLITPTRIANPKQLPR